MLPFFLLTIVFMLYEHIQAYLQELKGHEQNLRNVDYLIGVFRSASSSSEALEEALEAFKKHFLYFDGKGKESKEYQKSMDFIDAFSNCANVDIDKVVRYRDVFVKENPSYQKEIETIISSALKSREDHKGKKS